MSDAADYRIAVQRKETEDGVTFEGTVAEFPDVAVYADSATAAYAQVLDVIEGLRELHSSQGKQLPKPSLGGHEYSGKFIVRAPRSLHRSLALTANDEGVSLNQYVVSALSAHELLFVARRRADAMPVDDLGQGTASGMPMTTNVVQLPVKQR